MSNEKNHSINCRLNTNHKCTDGCINGGIFDGNAFNGGAYSQS